MSWKQHIRHISNKLSKSIGILKKARKTLYTSTLIQIYYTFLYPYMSAGITLWGTCNKTVIKTLETTQKKIIRLIFNKKNRTPSTPLFIKAKILPLDYIYILSTLSFMFKVYHNKYPPIIQNKFVRRYNISTQQTRQINLFEIPNFKTSLGERLLFYLGPKEFNHILRTTNVDLNISIHKFKRQMKSIFFQKIGNNLTTII